MDDLEKAAQIIKEGGIVIFPTDTAYGIGCNLTDEKAVEKLFSIRKRPKTQATPALFNSIDQVKEYLLPFEGKVEDLMRKYWPGALTIILSCKREKVPSLVRGGGETLGVRIPNNKQITELIRLSGVPVLGPSANFHTEPTPYSFEELNPDLVKLVDFVVKGDVVLKEASTVIDCSTFPWKVIRQGAIVDLGL